MANCERAIIFLRHAESQANRLSIYQGQTYDTDLSKLGEAQARAVAERLGDEPLTRIIASPLKRTIQTATAIAQLHKNVQIQPEFRIVETNHGLWEGVSAKLVGELWPDISALWKQTPSKTLFPHGEDFCDTHRRAVTWWHDIIPVIDEGTTAVVTHDNIIRALLTTLLGRPLDEIWDFKLNSTGITRVTLINGQSNVVYINDTSHLEGLPATVANHAL